MKSIQFLVLFLFIPKLFFGQTKNDKIIYLDSLWNETTIQNYKYLRVIKEYTLDKKEYVVNDYYDSGKIQMIGKTTDSDKLIRTGQFAYYYKNGNREKIINYIKNKPVGITLELYENGGKKLEAEYIKEKKNDSSILIIKNYWDENNNQKVIDGNGIYEEHEKGFNNKGKIKNGFYDGLWEGYDKKIGYTFSENYENGKFISGVSIDSNKVEHKYNLLEIRPEPKKGINNFYHHIARTFKTPKVEGLKGKVFTTFVVETDGSVKDIKVLRDVGYGTGEEAVKVISSYKNWLPGEKRGIKVRCTFSLPINIETSR